MSKGMKKKDSPCQWYVVHRIDHLQDGTEESTWLVQGIGKALDSIAENQNRYGDRINSEYELFKLGEAIPIALEKSETQEIIVHKTWTAKVKEQ